MHPMEAALISRMAGVNRRDKPSEPSSTLVLNTSDMEEIELGMSNFDHEIDEGFAEALKERPGLVCGRHAGYNFNGIVYYADGMFHEEVWVYGSPVRIVSEETLEELKESVCDAYGYE